MKKAYEQPKLILSVLQLNSDLAKTTLSDGITYNSDDDGWSDRWY